MAKAPSFQFYVKDWLTDVELQAASASTRGVWINALCLMWEARERGTLRGAPAILARMLNCSESEFRLFISENSTLKFADVTVCNEEVTLSNRRMVKEQKARECGRLRVSRHRSNATCNADVTVPSSSSSSSPSSNPASQGEEEGSSNPCASSPKKRPKSEQPKKAAGHDDFEAFWAAYPRKKSKGQAMRAWAATAKSRPELHVLLDAIAAQSAGHDWQKEAGKFIPYPATWLNGQRWLDEVQGPGAMSAGNLTRQGEKNYRAAMEWLAESGGVQ